MPAPKGNQNAAVPAKERKTAFLHILCHPKEKKSWMRSAEKSGGLAKWVRETLNARIGINLSAARSIAALTKDPKDIAAAQ